MRRLYKHIITVAFVCLTFATVYGQVKMNETQVIGSHNSYKIGIEKPLMDMILAERPEAKGLEYTHIPIIEQLDLGLRGSGDRCALSIRTEVDSRIRKDWKC